MFLFVVVLVILVLIVKNEEVLVLCNRLLSSFFVPFVPSVVTVAVIYYGCLPYCRVLESCGCDADGEREREREMDGEKERGRGMETQWPDRDIYRLEMRDGDDKRGKERE